MKRFIKFWLRHGNWILEWILMPGMMVFWLSLFYRIAIPEGRWAVAILAELFLAVLVIPGVLLKGLRPVTVVTALVWLGIVILERAYFLEIALWTVKGIGLFAVFVVGVALLSKSLELVVIKLSEVTEEAQAELEEERKVGQE